MDSRNCRMRNTPNGPARNGRTSPAYVLVSPMLLTSTNCGTNVTMPGTISVPSTSRNTTRRPGNGSLARA